MFQRWLFCLSLDDKKASEEALAVDMGIPISLVWQIMRPAPAADTSPANSSLPALKRTAAVPLPYTPDFGKMSLRVAVGSCKLT
ncbi:hypothetical protein D3C78_780880 [compost metagenome]